MPFSGVERDLGLGTFGPRLTAIGGGDAHRGRCGPDALVVPNRGVPPCATPLLAGSVNYAPEPLEPPTDGQILTCCSRPVSDLVLDM